ncbi:MAG: glycosyltransferase [Cyclobacteriaceae bacterium]
MADPRILLFTDQFPYGEHEQFLETEIVELAKCNSSIVVMPSRLTQHSRVLPYNVACELDLALHLKASFLKKLLWLGKHVLPIAKALYYYRDYLFRGDASRRILRFLYNSRQTSVWLEKYFASISDPTIFYTYWFGANALGLAEFASSKQHFKVVVRAHGHDLYEDRHQPAMIPFREEALKKIDKVFFVSRHGLDYLSNKYPWAVSKYQLACLGVNDPGFLCSVSGDKAWRIVSCSSILEVKQLDLLLDSLMLLANETSSKRIIWSHIGEGPLKGKLERIIQNSCPQNLECIFLGQLTNKKVLRFYRENPVDIFANVSKSEGVPVSIMEAQSCGIPVLAPKVGGIPEIVNNENGVLLNSNPTKQIIKDALFRTLSDDIKSRRSKSRLNWERNYRARENYRAFYGMLTS